MHFMGNNFMPNVTLVTNYEDWEGLYIDGVLKTEGHSIALREAFEACGILLFVKEADHEWLDEQGSLPDTLKEVKLAV